MATNDDIMRAIGGLEARTKIMAEDIADMKAYMRDQSGRVGSLERSRAALWAGLLAAKVTIVAAFAYLVQRGHI